MRTEEDHDAQDEASCLDSDEVGTIGQDAFRVWCSQALITATPPTKDKFGWDYQLQWDRPGASFDPPDVTCFLQVKTTAAGAKSAGIKLSNWRRITVSRNPWFVVAIGLHEREVTSVHVVPIDESLVKQAVGRLHDRDPSVAEHRGRMSIGWREEHRLGKPFHESLRASLLAHMGPSEEEYRQRKRDWIKAAQEEAKQTEGRFSIAAATEGEFHRLLARFAVGLEESLPIKDFKVALKKTGGDAAEPAALAELSVGTITLQDRKPDGTTTMILSNRERSETVTLKLDTYVSGFVFPFLPKERQIARFVSPMLSFVWHPTDGDQAVFTTHFEMPWDGTFTLTALSRVCRAARMFAEARTNGLHATLESDILSVPVGVDLSASPEAVFTPDFLESVRVVEDAGLLARFFDLDTDSIDISAAELLKRRASIRTFAAGIVTRSGRSTSGQSSRQTNLWQARRPP
jgi:hypothetical protein